MTWSLLDRMGHRKYLIASERKAFVRKAAEIGGPTGTLCLVLAFTGARISEALGLTPERIDEANGAIIFETLKRRSANFRAVPVPMTLLRIIDDVHHFRTAQGQGETATQRIWSWSRTTAWKEVRSTLLAAGVAETLAMPKALRHAFGVGAVNEKISLSMIQKWLGHARVETTVIYTTPIGDEERALARLMWHDLLPDEPHATIEKAN